jgi:predicted nucleotidyltransferase
MNLSRPMRVVTPTLDGDVLVVLARTDAPLTGRQVHALLGRASEPGVRRVLDRLVEQGVVLRSAAGRAHLYRLNREHLAAPHIEALAALRSTLIERLRSQLEAWSIRSPLAALYGSTARGESDEESDLDLLVIRPASTDPDDPCWRGQVEELERKTRAWTGSDAEVLELGEDELAGRRASEHVLASAARDGVALAGSLSLLKRSPRGRTSPTGGER